MSYCFKLSAIPIPIRQRIASDLTVTSTSSSKQLSSSLSVEVFYIQEQTNGDHLIYLPFSYSYHFLLSSVSPILYEYPKLEFKFNGKLLQRQIDIRDETFEILNRTKSVVLCLHTGFGKTIFSLYLASKIGLKIIVLCHRKIIMDQWKEAIELYLPNISVDIWSPNLSTTPDVLISNVLNITKWPKEKYLSYGLVIADEVHTMCTETFSKSFFWLSPKYMIGLSATPYRTDDMDRIIELYFGPEIVSKSMKKIFNAYQFNTGFVPTVEYMPNGTMNWNSVLNSQAKSVSRNNLICDMVRIFSNRTILVLIKYVDHARLLYNQLKDKGEDVGVFLGKSKQVDYTCRVLIATYSKGGVGFDHPKLDMLITAADVEQNFMQYLGRVFRRDHIMPIYIDIIDNLNLIKKHAVTRKKICIEAGGKILNFSKSFKDFDLYRSLLAK